ncbi:MAG: integrin alpha [Planctomycetota bacterium]
MLRTLALAPLALLLASTALPQALIRSHYGAEMDSRAGVVAAAGDVDLDGVPDYLVGAPSTAVPARATLISGATGQAIWTRVAVPPEDLGRALCGVGDIDADGVPDFAVGAPNHSSVAPFGGRVYLVSGPSGTVLRTLDGTLQNTSLGSDLANAGDLDGDGVDDLIVGAPGDRLFHGGPSLGSARVYSGASGALLHTFYGDGNFWVWGSSVAAAGDVDGDGSPDVVVGSYTVGRVRVYSGRTGDLIRTHGLDPYLARLGADVMGLGDVDADGFDDYAASAPNGGPASLGSPGVVRVFSGASGATLFDVEGQDSGIDDYGTVMAAAGDWNGDGVTDFAATGYTRVEVRSGADGALLRTLLDGYGVQLFRLRNGLASPGDLDGDGIPELLYGDDRWDDRSSSPWQTEVGRVFVLSGSEVVGRRVCEDTAGVFGQRLLDAQGSARIADDDLTLTVANLPADTAGYFLTSNGTGVLSFPGASSGVLCIHDPGGMGRHYDSLQSTDVGGWFHFRVDLSRIPTPTGLTSVLPGETRYWQLWHRLGASSRFSTAVAVTFQ